MKHGFLSASLILLLGLFGCVPQSNTVARPADQVGRNSTQAPSESEGEKPSEGNEGTTGASPTPSDPGSSSPSVDPPSGDTPVGNTDPPVVSDPGPPVAGAPVSLRLNLTKGLEVKYKSTETLSMQMPGAPDQGKPMEKTVDLVAKVTDVANGSAKIEFTSNFKGSMDPSKKDGSAKVSVMFNPLGKPSNLKYLTGTRRDAQSAGIDADTGFLNVSYPENPVKPGDKWSHTFDAKDNIQAMMPMPGATIANSVMTTNFTLKSVDLANGTAVLAVTSTGAPQISMKMPDMSKMPDSVKNDPKVKNMPKSMTISIKVNGTGTIIVDVKTGLPQQIDFDMTQVISNPMGGGNMTQKMKATTKKVS